MILTHLPHVPDREDGVEHFALLPVRVAVGAEESWSDEEPGRAALP